MTTRRNFLQSTALGAAVGTTVIGATVMGQPQRVHAAGNDVLRVGLIGCGGRGTGAAKQAMLADPNVKLVAMGDAFDDRLQLSLLQLQKSEDVAGKIDVPKERQFVGFDAYKNVIEASDVVLLTTPPHFRPLHLEAAINANKHVFAEKPVAVDGPGIRRVLKVCEQAKKKNLSVVSGLCLRYNNGFQELTQRIHDGEIGEVHTLQANDYRGGIWVRNRQDDWTDMHWQMRNWYYFTWLSGDFNVEQHVHFLDTCAWAMNNQYPVKAVGMGGRQVRVGIEHGNIFDHHSVTYEFENGAKLFSNTRQIRGCKNDMSAQVVGSKGRASYRESKNGINIEGQKNWTFEGKINNFYQEEHNALFKSIRDNKPINNGVYMTHSTLMAIMGRMATYTGDEVTWEQALNSKEDLTPPKYEWGAIEMPEVAIPGKTKFI